ncbi:hypothetical protein DFH09DRAFT_1367488 [Mycena vulgaris]|nr:hypothetical protein DFH09DRAFT_1367488 [Mycena vulgaris]
MLDDVISELFSADSRIGVNTPQLTASAAIHANVNRMCQPIGAEDFESFGTALSFGAGASLDFHASANGSLFGQTDGTEVAIFAHPVSFGSFPSPDDPACFAVVNDGPNSTHQPCRTGRLPDEHPAHRNSSGADI